MQTLRSSWIIVWCVLFFSSLDGVQADAQSIQLVDKPIQFLDDKKIQGTDSIIVPGATLLIGEVHGTWETPILVATLVRQAVRHDVEVFLCVELSSSEQTSIDQFLSSDGGDTAKKALLKNPHWTNQDGRASVGMFAMLELMRRLRSDGKRIQVIAMDANWTIPDEDIASLPPEKIKKLEELANGRDHEMAKSIIQAREKSAKAIVIAYAGNVHAKVTQGAAWDPKYVPMGWYVSQKVKNLISLDAEVAGGQAWVITERGTGPTNFSGKDRGPLPFVKLLESADSGYHGMLYVGRITAAKPVVGK